MTDDTLNQFHDDEDLGAGYGRWRVSHDFRVRMRSGDVLLANVIGDEEFSPDVFEWEVALLRNGQMVDILDQGDAETVEAAREAAMAALKRHFAQVGGAHH